MTGFYSLQLLSHKVLRWFSGLFALNVILGILCLAFSGHRAFQIIALSMILFLMLAYIGFLYGNQSSAMPVFYYPYYFVLVNIASLNGILQSIKGSVQVTWEHHRTTDGPSLTGRPSHFFIHTAAVLMCICGLRLLEEIPANRSAGLADDVVGDAFLQLFIRRSAIQFCSMSGAW